jgi:FAD/FMN-containing dehydrogenase
MTPELLNEFAAIVGEKHTIRDAAGMAGYMTEWREIWVGKSPLVMRPANTEEVSRILKLASETGTAIVPQSGNTGLVGGQIPFESGEDLERGCGGQHHDGTGRRHAEIGAGCGR